jgi:hypothetical protein
MPASTKPTDPQIHKTSRLVKLGQVAHWLLTLCTAAGNRKARNARPSDYSILHQATSGGAGPQTSNDAAGESFLLGMLAMAVFHSASGIMLGACLRIRAALIPEGPAGEAVSQCPAALATPIREEGFASYGAEAPETPPESRAEHPLFESIPATRSGKLQRYLGNLDAASRSNLERHLNNPDVSSTAICDSLRGHGFIIGQTTVKDYRRNSAARPRSDAGTGANQPANGLPLRRDRVQSPSAAGCRGFAQRLATHPPPIQ